MNITRENTGELTATVVVELSSEDYQPKVEEMLRDYRKKASIPGFRPGKVPFGVIRKMYGKSVLLEEVNKIMADAINKYVEDNKLDLFGYPLLNVEKLAGLEWEDNAVYAFDYDIAMVPEIDVVIDDSIKLTHYKIVAEDVDVEEYLKDIRKRYGKISTNEFVGDEDIVYGELIAIIEGDENQGDAFQKFVPVNVNAIADAAIKALFIGKSAGAEIVFDINKAFPAVSDIASMLDITPEIASDIKGNFKITVKEVVHVEPADLNEELFSKVFPGAEILDEESLRARIRQDIEVTYLRNAERQIYFDCSKEVKNKYPFTLPEDYLKRWLYDRNREEMSVEDIEKGFEYYVEELRWQILENKIIERYNQRVEHAEVRQYIKELIGMANVDEENNPDVKERVDRIVASIADNKDEVRRIYENLYSRKLTELFMQNCKLTEKSVNWKEFSKLVSEN